MGSVSIEDEMKGDVYSYAVILWHLMSRKTPWAHCIFFLLFSFSVSFSFSFVNELSHVF